jgi:hypothetical protein
MKNSGYYVYLGTLTTNIILLQFTNKKVITMVINIIITAQLGHTGYRAKYIKG